MTFPTLARVRQTAPQPRLADVPGTVRRAILESGLRDRVKPGGTIAVGIGSRGIAAIPAIARAAIDTLKELGYRPFVVAAMGSHGGATPQGQRELLAGYGSTPVALGVDVRTEMDTVVLGEKPHRPADPLRQERLRGRRYRPSPVAWFLHTDFTGTV